MPLEQLGASTTPESIGRELHRLLAEGLCQHFYPYCDSCFSMVTGIVQPVARMITVAAMFERKNTNSAYVGIGQGFEAFTKAIKEDSRVRTRR